MTVKQGFVIFSIGLMRMPGRVCLSLWTGVFVLLLGACATNTGPHPSEADISPCQIIYDAGSKGTRLYVYQQTAAGWVRHRGPRTGALADPVRAIRGKTMSDADTVIDDIVAALENIRRDGPVGKKGKPQWPAFDWQEQCSVNTVSVYATAGMRIAEQLDAVASEALWGKLNNRLSSAVDMKVITRTLSGYEEGLFAWLATRELQDDGDFGVAEMGGASLQVTFPCQLCESSRQVKVKGQTVPIYSHSFPGWGQDEAWKKMGASSACARGAGIKNPDWKETDCSTGMVTFADAAVDVSKDVGSVRGLRWYLSDAFRYMRDSDIDQFCRKGTDSGYEPESSCFRAVYLENVLRTLGLPADSEHSKVDWTLGAVVCTATRCLETDQAGPKKLKLSVSAFFRYLNFTQHFI